MSLRRRAVAKTLGGLLLRAGFLVRREPPRSTGEDPPAQEVLDPAPDERSHDLDPGVSIALFPDQIIEAHGQLVADPHVDSLRERFARLLRHLTSIAPFRVSTR